MRQGKFLPSNVSITINLLARKNTFSSFLSGSWKIASFLPFRKKIFSGSDVSNSRPEPCLQLCNFYEIFVIQNIAIDC